MSLTLYWRLALSLVFILGCSTAKKRDYPTNILQDIKPFYRDFSAQHRAGNIYEDFELEIEVEAILKDASYQTMLNQAANKEAATGDRLDQALATDKDLNFLVLIYTPEHRIKNAEELQKAWSFSLQGDKHNYLLVDFVAVDESNLEYKFISDNLATFDRWSTVFSLNFVPQAANNESAGAANEMVTMTIKGLVGETRMSWDLTARN